MHWVGFYLLSQGHKGRAGILGAPGNIGKLVFVCFGDFLVDSSCISCFNLP